MPVAIVENAKHRTIEIDDPLRNAVTPMFKKRTLITPNAFRDTIQNILIHCRMIALMSPLF